MSNVELMEHGQVNVYIQPKLTYVSCLEGGTDMFYTY